MKSKLPQSKELHPNFVSDGRGPSLSENDLLIQVACQTIGLPDPVREYVFHPVRRWRFDYAWPTLKLAIEIDGGVYKQGRHTTGKGFEEDRIKDAEAIVLGWRVFHFSTGQIQRGVHEAYLRIYYNNIINNGLGYY